MYTSSRLTEAQLRMRYLYEHYSTQDIAKLLGADEPLLPLVFTPPPITDLKKPDGFKGFVDTVHLEKMRSAGSDVGTTLSDVEPDLSLD